MILKDKKKKNKIMKKIMSSTLALTMTFSLASCVKKDNDNSFDNISESSISDELSYEEQNQNYINDKNFFANIVSSYEINDDELKGYIDDIINVKYNPKSPAFSNYNIYNMPKLEMDYIMKNTCYREYEIKSYDNNYDWIKNGKVDNNLLFNKIKKNNKECNIDEDSFINDSIQVFCQNIENIVYQMQYTFPKYDFSVTLKNINDLTIDLTYDEDCYCCYSQGFNTIYVNPNLNDSMDLLKDNITHEMGHLILNRLTNNEQQVQRSGCSIDCLDTEEAPLRLRFIDEYIAEEISTKANNKENSRFETEENCINLIASFTDKSKDEVLNAYCSGDPNNIMNLFEPEVRNINYVFSTLYAVDLYCGYGNHSNDIDLNSDFINYAITNLLKNYYIKMTKDLKLGNINKEDANDKLFEIRDKLTECGFSFFSQDLLLLLDDNIEKININIR